MTEKNNDINQLPKDWKWVKVSSVAELYRGINYTKNVASNISSKDKLPILRGNNINGELNYEGLVYVPKELIKLEQLIKKDDIIFAMSSGSKHLVGKSAVAKSDFEGSYGAFCSMLRINDDVSKQYVAYIFKGNSYRKLISEIAKGTNINNLKREHILDFEFPLPPKPTQLAIISKIEEIFSELEKGMESLFTAKQQLKTYRQSVLKWAFEGKLSESGFTRLKDEQDLVNNEILQSSNSENPDSDKGELPNGWKWEILGEVSKVSGGLTKNSKRQNLKLKLPFLRVANVYFNRLDLAEMHNIGINETEIERVRLEPNDLLFVEGNGSIEQIGRVALWNGKIKNCVHQNHLIKSRLSKEVIPKYALYFFCSKLGRDNIKQQANSTSGLHTLSLGKISKLRLPLAPISEQNSIVQSIESRLSVADKMEESITQSLQQAQALKQSILKKAFEGKLV